MHPVSFLFIVLKGQSKKIELHWTDPKNKDRKTLRGVPFVNQDITIDLNGKVEDANDISWLSVWCEDFRISFGDLVFNSKNTRQNACSNI